MDYTVDRLSTGSPCERLISMKDEVMRRLLQNLGKKRRKITQDAEAVRREIHGAALRAAAAGWNNQEIADEVGVTREIIRRHVGPSKTFAEVGQEVERGAQESS